MHPELTMSDQLPFHIQEEIMKRLPVKSLIQFRSVSKSWKSLIDTSHFITAHSHLRHTQPQHLLVLFSKPEEELDCVSFVDDETLIHQKPVPNSPLFLKQNFHTKIVGISHGLVCFYYLGAKLTVIWNPSIRKSIIIAVPNRPHVGQRFVSFGVCPATTDPKIVAFTQVFDKSNTETKYQYEVMIYTLSSKNWRSLSTNLPTKPILDWWWVVSANGFIYWRGGLPGHNIIISFDVTNEIFQMIDLPNNLSRLDFRKLHIYKLKGSLAILQYHKRTYTVWMMEGGVQRSFTKLFTVHALKNSIVGFTKSGVPIRKVEKDGRFKLVVYEPNSEHDNVVEICGSSDVFTVDSYMETLLLLGRFDCISC